MEQHRRPRPRVHPRVLHGATPARASFELLADGDAPRYEEGTGVRTKELVGPRARFSLHGDVRLFTDSWLDAASDLTLDVGAGEVGMLYVLEGEVRTDGDSVGLEHALIVPPHDEARSVTVRADDGAARVIRVVSGPGHGFVLR